ncbi:hypothetical protein PHMEG_000706 [Phytophthora megakarya]|uniref:B box-type domain-containing protein n=1 Tax=Phytophthora megakarya TaxID=4795 RepID=A0A225X4V8_9STRA|nr:hypothetical protein PHMEG_000706 [Phytophthora megakarya]
MVETDDAKASASLARLRLFLSSHTPNGPDETRPPSPKRSATETPKDNDQDKSGSQPAPPHPEQSGWGTNPEVLLDDEDEDATQATTIPAAGAVASVTPMSQASKDFARVKYLLQCSLPGYRVHEGVVIWDMRNPSLVAQYEQHTAGLLELESWVSVNDLGAAMGDVHSYGFTSLDANQTGMKFTTGNLQLSAPLDAPAEAKKPSSTRQLVLCKIAIVETQLNTNTEPTEAQINEIVAKQMEDGLLTDDTQAPTCRTHRNKKVEFYCTVCQTPVCVTCKMVGDHSIGEKGSHRLLTVADAYENCLRESLRPDPLITSRKTVIENKLQVLTRIQRSVQENKSQVADAIKEQCARTLRKLDEEVAVKTRVLSGEMLEFERQLQQIDWVDESLEDHRTILPAVEFLSAWSQHKLLRAEQRDFPPFAHGSNNSAEQVKADLQLVGELRVVSADQLAATRHHRRSFAEGDVGPATTEGDSGNQGGFTDGSHVELKAAVLLAQHQCSGDSDLRKRLLNMKAALPASPNAGVFMASRCVVSPKCQQLLDEVRHDIMVQNSSKKNPATAVSPLGAGSPRSRFGIPLGLASRMGDSTATLRAFSVQANMKRNPDDELRSPRQRRGTSAWSTLLRHEMGLTDSN